MAQTELIRYNPSTVQLGSDGLEKLAPSLWGRFCIERVCFGQNVDRLSRPFAGVDQLVSTNDTIRVGIHELPQAGRHVVRTQLGNDDVELGDEQVTRVKGESGKTIVILTLGDAAMSR